MKHAVTFLILFLCINNFIYSIESVEFEVVRTFSIGADEEQFGITTGIAGIHSPVPAGLVYISDGQFYANDNSNNRGVLIDTEQTWEEVYQGGAEAFAVSIIGPYLYIFHHSAYDILLLEDFSLMGTGRPRLGISGPYYKSIVALNDMVMVNDQKNREPVYYGAYIGDEDFTGEFQFMPPEETQEFIENEYEGDEDLRFDADGYLFWGDRLVAPYGRGFVQYHWNENSTDIMWRRRIQYGQLLGWDTEQNSYWADFHAIVVVSPAGELVTEFYGENIDPYQKSQFTMSEDGTLYVLSLNNELEQFELMKLERFW